MNLMTPEAKGRRAQEILDDAVFQEAQERAAVTLTKRWKSAPTSQEREALWHQLQALDAVTASLRAIAGDGDFAAHDRLKQERRQADG